MMKKGVFSHPFLISKKSMKSHTTGENKEKIKKIEINLGKMRKTNLFRVA